VNGSEDKYAQALQDPGHRQQPALAEVVGQPAEDQSAYQAPEGDAHGDHCSPFLCKAPRLIEVRYHVDDDREGTHVAQDQPRRQQPERARAHCLADGQPFLLLHTAAPTFSPHRLRRRARRHLARSKKPTVRQKAHLLWPVPHRQGQGNAGSQLADAQDHLASAPAQERY
jgi:hypothetical protein